MLVFVDDGPEAGGEFTGSSSRTGQQGDGGSEGCMGTGTAEASFADGNGYQVSLPGADAGGVEIAQDNPASGVTKQVVDVDVTVNDLPISWGVAPVALPTGKVVPVSCLRGWSGALCSSVLVIRTSWT